MSSGWAITWRWKNDDVRLVLDAITDSPRPLLHVCSGSSGIGDVRIDAKKICINSATSHERFVKQYTAPANVIGDMFDLPIRNAAAGTIICDPPYIDEAMDSRLIAELVRVLQPGGILLFYAPWVPSHQQLYIDRIVPMKINRKSSIHKLFTVYHKTQASLSDF